MCFWLLRGRLGRSPLGDGLLVVLAQVLVEMVLAREALLTFSRAFGLWAVESDRVREVDGGVVAAEIRGAAETALAARVHADVSTAGPVVRGR